MKRPFANKRPIGPFAQINNNIESVDSIGIAAFGISEERMVDLATDLSPPLSTSEKIIGTKTDFVDPRRPGKLGKKDGEQASILIIELPVSGDNLTELVNKLKDETDDVVRII